VVVDLAVNKGLRDLEGIAGPVVEAQVIHVRGKRR
jgi:hypothetical protein